MKLREFLLEIHQRSPDELAAQLKALTEHYAAQGLFDTPAWAIPEEQKPLPDNVISFAERRRGK